MRRSTQRVSKLLYRRPKIMVSSWGIGGARGLDRSGISMGGKSIGSSSARLYGRAGRAITVKDNAYSAGIEPMKTRRSELASVGALDRKKSGV